MLNEAFFGEGVKWAKIEHEGRTYVYSTRGDKQRASAILCEVYEGDKCLYDLGPYGRFSPIPPEVKDKLGKWLDETYELEPRS